MQYTRIYSGPDGASHFADEELTVATLDFAPPAPPLHMSAFSAATRIGFLQELAGWVGEAHTTPRRQYAIVLAGEFRVTVTGGETRSFLPGSVVLLDDTTGAGHSTSLLGAGDSECRMALVQLADGE